MPVGGGAGDPEGDAVAVDAGLAFHAAFAAVDREPASLAVVDGYLLVHSDTTRYLE